MDTIFFQELLLASRRGRHLVFRWIYCGWLTILVSGAFIGYYSSMNADSWTGLPPDSSITSQFATSLVQLLMNQQFLLTLLMAPAITAGAITDEKTRGTLQYLLTTDLSDRQLVLGKLFARMVHSVSLLLCAMPLIAFVSIFSEVTPPLLLGLLGTNLTMLFAVSAASLLASVWCRTTRDAVITFYAGVLVLVALNQVVVIAHHRWGLTIPGIEPGRVIFRLFDPLLIFGSLLQAESDRSTVGWHLLGSLLAWGSVGIGCVCLAIVSLRPAFVRQLHIRGPSRRWSLWRPRRAALIGNPIMWKEHQVDGIAPLAALRQVPSGVGLCFVTAATLLVSLGAIVMFANPPITWKQFWVDLQAGRPFAFASDINEKAVGEVFHLQAIVVLFVVTFLIGMRCSGAVCGERERQTWEALLLTPLETSAIIRGKIAGVMRAILPYLLAYLIPVLLVCPLAGIYALTWTLVLLLVTQLGSFYMAAAGIWCSVRSRGSWQALLSTLGFGYLGGFLLFVVTSPVTLTVAIMLLLLMMAIDKAYGTQLTQSLGGAGQFVGFFFLAACLVLAGFFFLLSIWFIKNAEYLVAMRERVRTDRTFANARPSLTRIRVRKRAKP